MRHVQHGPAAGRPGVRDHCGATWGRGHFSNNVSGEDKGGPSKGGILNDIDIFLNNIWFLYTYH